jgi:hypothetical protein
LFSEKKTLAAYSCLHESAKNKAFFRLHETQYCFTICRCQHHPLRFGGKTPGFPAAGAAYAITADRPSRSTALAIQWNQAEANPKQCDA